MTTNNSANTYIVPTSSQEVTRPLQPSFLAFNSTTRLNVTGDNTPYVIVFNTEVYDQNADFDGTSTFTSPVTGRYKFQMQIEFNDVGTNGSNQQFITSNRTYYFGKVSYGNVKDVNSTYSEPIGYLGDMDAADTAYYQGNLNGGTKTVDIKGHATEVHTYFSGSLAN